MKKQTEWNEKTGRTERENAEKDRRARKRETKKETIKRWNKEQERKRERKKGEVKKKSKNVIKSKCVFPFFLQICSLCHLFTFCFY